MAVGTTQISHRLTRRFETSIPSIVYFTPFRSAGVGRGRKKSWRNKSEFILSRKDGRSFAWRFARNAKPRVAPDACSRYLDTVSVFSSRGFATMSTTSVDPWFQTLFADRIGGVNYGKGSKIYKFEKIKRAKRAALAAHPERRLLDFGIGENDDLADPLVRATLKQEVDKLENRGYADNGIAAFKEAAAGFLKKVFDVTLDPATEINHAIGSKPALAMMPAVFINPGDITLMTVPGYPVAGTHTAYYGGEVYNLPLREENGFYPDLNAIPADVRRRAKLLVINYPNSPTGAVATRDFYRRVIDFARTNQIVVVQDAAHILLSYEGPPLSFLQVE